MKTVFRKTLRGLVPVDEDAHSEFSKCKLDRDVMVEIKRHRNMHNHNKYWVLCTIIADNSERWPTKERASHMLKIATGHYDEVLRPNGGIDRVPHSMSIASMEAAKFEAFFDQVINLTCAKIIPHLDPGGLRSEIENLCGIGAVA
ncbi:DUF1367 family protein [Denitrobaculum tricleocarpae]|uniref:DUF1367 family protein n=1 Tax=Denitrobaculum tricleocarpae TaxID=2591009 RepID=A0A545TT18_9PROT|nr:DUF1367 family protein [Denitrobaculum tricleocarpae]TQV80363.1 DUF1367 family protein [Denitrobaculum tricleocarpae]